MPILRQNILNVNDFKEKFIMEYIYRMSRKMYFETAANAKDCKMTVEQYITATFGLRGKCVKIEIA